MAHKMLDAAAIPTMFWMTPAHDLPIVPQSTEGTLRGRYVCYMHKPVSNDFRITTTSWVTPRDYLTTCPYSCKGSNSGSNVLDIT
mmetsp:Transcript_38020/g.87962  ORF Transcript_38020/g.87962 Transcript_38020/m.87962 type:complete len:85 (-) Transcript_38020:505-759(-)